jgi:hypothetical protein
LVFAVVYSYDLILVNLFVALLQIALVSRHSALTVNDAAVKTASAGERISFSVTLTLAKLLSPTLGSPFVGELVYTLNGVDETRVC